MKNKFYIIGAGGFAKEILYLVEESFDESYDFLGFIDFNPKDDCIKIRGNVFPVIEEDTFLNTVTPQGNLVLFFGIGDPLLLEKLSIRFQNFNFPNLFHKSFIGDRNSINFGKGNIITAGCIFTVDINVGSFNIFNLHTTIGHDVVIKDFNIFNPGCNISGDVVVGSKNLFGTNSTILQGINVGNNNILGASSLAIKNIQSNCVMVGVPAKKIKENENGIL